MHKLVTLLHRDTGKSPYVAEIDSFRFVAIAFVILYHLLQKTDLALLSNPALFTSRLNRGVQLFFTISGFVLALPFAKHRLLQGKEVSPKAYFLRRLTRIEPPYLASIGLCLAILVVVKHQSLHMLLPHFAATVLYLHSLIYAALSTINPVAWSLEVEIQFYLLCPVLALLFAIKGKLPRRATMAVAVLALSAFALYLNGHYRSDHSLLGTSQFFIAGFLLADIYLLDGPAVRSYLWDAVAAGGWFLVLATNKQWWNLMMPLGLVAVYWSAFSGRITGHIFRSKFTSIVGGMCYSIYLIHQQIIGVVAMVFHRAVLIWAISLSLIAICCTIFFLLVERPCMNHDWPIRLCKWLGVQRRKAVIVIG